MIHYRLGQMKEAIADADMSLKFTTDRPQPFFIRGLAKIASGDQQGGKKDLDEATRIDAGIANYFAKYGVK